MNMLWKHRSDKTKKKNAKLLSAQSLFPAFFSFYIRSDEKCFLSYSSTEQQKQRNFSLVSHDKTGDSTDFFLVIWCLWFIKLTIGGADWTYYLHVIVTKPTLNSEKCNKRSMTAELTNTYANMCSSTDSFKPAALIHATVESKQNHLNFGRDRKWERVTRWTEQSVMFAMERSFRSPPAIIIAIIAVIGLLFCKRLRTKMKASLHSKTQSKFELSIALSKRRRTKRVNRVSFSRHSKTLLLSLISSYWAHDIWNVQLHFVRFGERVGLPGLQRRAPADDIADVRSVSALARNCVLR